VTVTANALQGVFDVEYDLSTNSPTGQNRPFGLGGSRTLHQIRLRIEPPFVRRAERNQYRAALIAYQRQRRNLMAFEDNIVTDARTDLRLLRQLEQTFQVQLRALELAYAQVDNARGTLTAPPDPRSTDPSAAAASQTEQLLQVQAQLVRAQNDLYTTWVRYLNARMSLYLDLELLPLDARGLWSDEPAASPAAPAAPPPAPAEGVPAPAGGQPPADPGVPGPGRVDGGPVRGPGTAPGRTDPGVARPERLPEPVALPPPADRGPADVVPLLSLPNPDAAPPLPLERVRPADLVGRADPFPPLVLPAPPRVDAGGRVDQPPPR
jgi:hypothetical protein